MLYDHILGTLVVLELYVFIEMKMQFSVSPSEDAKTPLVVCYWPLPGLRNASLNKASLLLAVSDVKHLSVKLASRKL